ncbi:MAG: S49 family peptidase [Oceanospirillaceae bacterium]
MIPLTNCKAWPANADHRLITQTGVAGSVGVVVAHVDQSKMLNEQGIQVTLIHSRTHKVAGNALTSVCRKIFRRGTEKWLIHEYFV